MKTKFPVSSSVSLLSVFAAVLVMVAGCATTGREKAADTGEALIKAAGRIANSSALIDQTVAALNELVDHPRPDLRPQFEAFKASLNRLVPAVQDVEDTTANMQSLGADYFKKWDTDLATINNEDLRNRGEARKAVVNARFAAIGAEYANLKTAYAPFMSDMRDVEKYLSTDLTPGGVATIKPTADKANRNAGPLRDSIAKLSAEFSATGVAWVPDKQAK